MTEIRTLIVDDEPLARATIAELLRNDPEISVVGECGSGTEAIEAIRTCRPSLLFLDVQMPGCDGFDVIEQLGGDSPRAVVFVTAYDKYALKAFEVEALDYLLKPYSDSRFFRVLAPAKALLEQSKAESLSLNRLMVKSAGRVRLTGSKPPTITPACMWASDRTGSRDVLPNPSFGNRQYHSGAGTQVGCKRRVRSRSTRLDGLQVMKPRPAAV